MKKIFWAIFILISAHLLFSQDIEIGNRIEKSLYDRVKAGDYLLKNPQNILFLKQRWDTIRVETNSDDIIISILYGRKNWSSQQFDLLIIEFVSFAKSKGYTEEFYSNISTSLIKPNSDEGIICLILSGEVVININKDARSLVQ
jgi:hypothetical protein